MDLPWGFYLDWGWPWLIFFIMLIASFVLVVVLMKQVLWLLPGLVLYFGLYWEIPGGWSFLFRLIFWVSALIAVITAFRRGRRTRLAKVPMLSMVALIVWCFVLWLASLLGNLPGWDWLWWLFVATLLLGVVYLFFVTRTGVIILGIALLLAGINIGVVLLGSNDKEEAKKPEDACLSFYKDLDPEFQKEVPDGYKADHSRDCTKKKVAPPDVDTDVDVEVCPARFVQDLDPNWRYRYVTDGFEGTSREKRRQFLAAMASDYRYLDAVADYLFPGDVDRSELVTADRDCLGDKGRRRYLKVEGALLASGIENGLAPRDGVNTGMEDGGAVVAKNRGVYGDRSATFYTLEDGSTLIILDRCGNMVFISKPKGMPEGPTDNPKPHKPTKHSQPSGSGGVTPSTLKPKPSDPKDYIVEEGAPKETVSEPASQPSTVRTQSSGGGGVQDTPTNAPGSESGVQAPGADPAPTASAEPLPPQGAADDPSDGATSCVPPPGMTTC